MTASPLLLLSADSVDLISAIRENDLVGLICLIALTCMSIYSLMLIIQKYLEVKVAKRQSRAFQGLVDEDGSWEALFVASKRYPDSPLAKLLKETYVECRMENWFTGKKALGLENRLEIAKDTIASILNRTMSREESRLQEKLTILATISTIAPFIGLFGTVWGVLASFQAIGREGSAALSALAPGISTALMTTIFGLIAATPALIAYNYFTREVTKISGDMECFSNDIENAVRKQILVDEEKVK